MILCDMEFRNDLYASGSGAASLSSGGCLVTVVSECDAEEPMMFAWHWRVAVAVASIGAVARGVGVC